MINWVIIALAIVAIIVVSKMIHFKHMRHKMSAIIVILLLVFVYLTFVSVIKNNSLDLKTASGILQAGKIYFLWLFQAFGNVKSLTGNAINMQWMPKNISLSG